MGLLDYEVAVAAASNSEEKKTQKPYWKWSNQERFKIRKYVAINGPAAAAREFGSKGRPINDSIVRGFCSMYQAELKERRMFCWSKTGSSAERTSFLVGKFRSNGSKISIGCPK